MSRRDDETGDATCRKCHGEGVVEGRKMGVIGPWSEQADIPGDFYVCPRCGGNGREP